MAEGTGEGLGEGTGNGDEAKPVAATTPGDKPAAVGSDQPQAEAGDTTHSSSAADVRNLPVIVAPSLAGEETIGSADAEATDEAPSESANDPAAPAAPARLSRFALLSASIALAAAFGSFVGTMSASGVAGRLPGASAAPTAETADALRMMKAELAELSSLKASLDSATRGTNTQFAKIADRLDRVERAQADPGTKLAHIADTVDRLDKRSGAAPDVTGSISASQASASAPEPRLLVLPNWTVEEVQNGRALVASRFGMFEVGAGGFLPTLGHVESIKREDGHWIVVTARGIISSGR